MTDWFTEYLHAASTLIFKTPGITDPSHDSQETTGAEVNLHNAIEDNTTEESQKMANMQVVARQVLDTNELLVMILSELPAKDLLLSQRISRALRDTIQSRSQLQRALFMQQTSPTNNAPLEIPDLTLNLIFQGMLQPWRCVCFQVGIVLLQLGIFEVVKDSTSTRVAEPEQLVLKGNIRINRRAEIQWLRAKICKPGSWRDMYLSQPPCQTILTVSGRTGKRNETYEFDATTLGEMLDAIAKEVPEVDHYFLMKKRKREAELELAGL